MISAVRECLVRGYEPLVDVLELPDLDDRHVLAAAVRAKAQVIVTFNLKDFPADALSPWDVEAVHPDTFLEAQIDLAPQVVYAAVQRIADSCKKPARSVADIIARLEQQGLVASAAALRALSIGA